MVGPSIPAAGLEDVAAWFGNPDWGLGLPAPLLMATLAWSAEYLGAIALALGTATRWVCIPLMLTMVVAATSVHWDNGWQAVHDLKSPYPAANTEAAIDRLDRAKSILAEHGNYDWLTEHGPIVSANNGIEWGGDLFHHAAGLILSRWWALLQRGLLARASVQGTAASGLTRLRAL